MVEIFRKNRAFALVALGLMHGQTFGCGEGGVALTGSFGDAGGGAVAPDAGLAPPPDAALAPAPDAALAPAADAALAPAADAARGGDAALDAMVEGLPDGTAGVFPDALADDFPDALADALAAAPDARAPGVHTALGPDGHLRLLAGEPALAADCAPGCPDEDADGLSDTWEAVALDRLRPRLVFDEEETLVHGDAEAVVAMVGRVAPAPDVVGNIRVFVMIGYSRDYGSCGVTFHDGDSERVAFDLAPLAGGGGNRAEAGDFEVVGLYTAAHEHTITDHSVVYRGADLLAHAEFAPEADLGGEPRWVVYPSADKHGTYIDVPTCEGISILPCLDEDCAPDGLSPEEAAAYTRLPPVFDAGEPAHPRLTDLAGIGFPGDDAWAEQDFCGGRARDNCSAAVREKLLDDPFVGR